jgi:5-methylcytosine-specific restriction endonuclease McrA
MTIRWTAEERAKRDEYRKSVRDRRPAREKLDKDPVQLGGEAVVIPPRPAVSAALRARVIAKSDGHCAYPCCEVRAGLEVDHVIPRELGGSDAEHNLSALCGPHHKQKTARDVKMIAKARRIRKGLTEPRKPSRIRSAPFSDDYQPMPPSRGFR